MTCSPDYAYGRDTTAQFIEYLKHFAPDVELVGETWPKLFQPDYTDVITKILQAKPQALYSALWGGDLTAYIDQGNIYALFTQTEFFAVNMADYTALTAVKNLPKGIHSGNRYIKAFPNTPENAAWSDAYRAKFGDYPTNWSWENALDPFPLGGRHQGKLCRWQENRRGYARPDHQVSVRRRRHDDHAGGGPDRHRLCHRLGQTISSEPYVPTVAAGDWKQILELEAVWKKKNNYA